MPDYNKFTQLGRLVRDPELRYSQSGTAIASLCVATTTRYGAEEHKKDQVFMDWTVFGRRGEALTQHFSKGDPIFITGRIKTNSWTDANGQKRSRNEGIADEWQFVGNTQKHAQDAQRGPRPASAVQQPAPPGGVAPIPRDDDIPF